MNLLRERALRSCVISIAFVLFLPVFPAASAQSGPDNPIRFRDVTEKSGIRFTHFKGNKNISINLEEFGPGVDYDRDGKLDLYCDLGSIEGSDSLSLQKLQGHP